MSRSTATTSAASGSRRDISSLSYEPGWYRSLLAEHASRREPLVIPEAERIDVLLPDAELPDVVVPDLEDIRSEDEDR